MKTRAQAIKLITSTPENSRGELDNFESPGANKKVVTDLVETESLQNSDSLTTRDININPKRIGIDFPLLSREDSVTSTKAGLQKDPHSLDSNQKSPIQSTKNQSWANMFQNGKSNSLSLQHIPQSQNSTCKIPAEVGALGEALWSSSLVGYFLDKRLFKFSNGIGMQQVLELGPWQFLNRPEKVILNSSNELSIELPISSPELIFCYGDLESAKLMKDSLTLFSSLSDLGIADNKDCLLCNQEEENMNHLFFDCAYSNQVMREVYGMILPSSAHDLAVEACWMIRAVSNLS